MGIKISIGIKIPLYGNSIIVNLLEHRNKKFKFCSLLNNAMK